MSDPDPPGDLTRLTTFVVTVRGARHLPRTMLSSSESYVAVRLGGQTRQGAAAGVTRDGSVEWPDARFSLRAARAAGERRVRHEEVLTLSVYSAAGLFWTGEPQGSASLPLTDAVAVGDSWVPLSTEGEVHVHVAASSASGTPPLPPQQAPEGRIPDTPEVVAAGSAAPIDEYGYPVRVSAERWAEAQRYSSCRMELQCRRWAAFLGSHPLLAGQPRPFGALADDGELRALAAGGVPSDAQVAAVMARSRRLANVAPAAVAAHVAGHRIVASAWSRRVEFRVVSRVDDDCWDVFRSLDEFAALAEHCRRFGDFPLAPALGMLAALRLPPVSELDALCADLEAWLRLAVAHAHGQSTKVCHTVLEFLGHANALPWLSTVTPHLRRRVWAAVTGAACSAKSASEGEAGAGAGAGAAAGAGAYRRLAASARREGEGDDEGLGGFAAAQEAVDAAVDIDLRRTGSLVSDDECAAVRRLFSVLPVVEPSVEYSQALNFVALALLRASGGVGEEEHVFWLLRALCTDVLPGYYERGMRGVQEDMALVAALVEERLPELAAHFREVEFPVELFVTQWLLSVFSSGFPAETVFRVWDVVFLGGRDALVVAVVAFLRATARRVLAADNLVGCSAVLKERASVWHDADALIQAIEEEREAIGGRLGALRVSLSGGGSSGGVAGGGWRV